MLFLISAAAFGQGPAPMPQQGTSGPVSVTGATTLTVTGLPTTLKTVDIKWWNYTSGAAWDPMSDSNVTYGQPSAYVLQGSTNGTTWTNLSCTPSCNVTGEHYTGRQFIVDLTGTNYTQVRMNISSIVGSNAGYDTLTVNGQPGTNNSSDTFLLFGDSITANCWVAANDVGSVEQLGYQVNAVVPTHFPVATIGGQSGWLTSTALSTSTYGVPNIQQFLTDLPAAKYIGVSLGTNDANGSVTAPTYCANMQTIVQDILGAGRIPIVPTLIPSPPLNLTLVQSYNSCLATVIANNPGTLTGPDLYSTFYPHIGDSSWWITGSTLHPSLGTGCSALQAAWVNTLKTTLYSAAPTGTVLSGVTLQGATVQ